jgi:hypothetical protein
MRGLVLIKNGSIQGWVIALCECIVVYGIWVISLFSESMTKNLEKTGGFITGIFGLSFGVWLAYKGATTIFGKGSEEAVDRPPDA